MGHGTHGSPGHTHTCAPQSSTLMPQAKAGASLEICARSASLVATRGGAGQYRSSTQTSHLGKLETDGGKVFRPSRSLTSQPASPAAAYRRGARVARGSVAGRVATDGGLLLRGDDVVELLAGGRGLRRRLAASHQHIRTAGRVAQHQHLRRESAIRARRVRRVQRAQRVRRVQRAQRVQRGRAPRRRGTWR